MKNKTITAKEANDQMIAAIEYVIAEFTELESKGKPLPKFTETIPNVSMLGIFELYKAVRHTRKRLLMPHELECDHYTLIICPFYGCTIVLESEPVKKVEVKIHKYNYN